MSIPRRIRRRVPNLVPINPVVWQLPQTFLCVTPPKTPWGIDRRIVFSLFHSQTNSQIYTKCGANRSSRLTASPNICICDPPKTQKCPWVLCGELYLAYVPAQTNPPTCTNFGADRCSRFTKTCLLIYLHLPVTLPLHQLHSDVSVVLAGPSQGEFVGGGSSEPTFSRNTH